MFGSYIRKFEHKAAKLSKACEKLGGETYVVGDVSYKIPVFDCLALVFQFWDADEEFDAQIKIKWDENVLSFMHFETVHYAMFHVLQRLEELI